MYEVLIFVNMKRVKSKKVKLHKSNASGRFLIRITKSSKRTYWYSGAWYVGKEYSVKWNSQYKSWQIIGGTKCIRKRDATVLKTLR